MTTKRGKRQGLRARSKNARSTAQVAKVTKVETARYAAPRITLDEREELYNLREKSMFFREVEMGAPREGALLLVRLTDGTFRFGMNLKGRFANYEYHNEEFVTFAHPERITHWMEVFSPVPFVAAGDDTQPDYVAPGVSIEQAAIAAASEDVYL